MEKWYEVGKGLIPNGNYETQMEFGEMTGLNILLSNKDNNIKFEFGNVVSFRIIEEGYVQKYCYCNQEVDKYKCNNFSNIIYRVEHGEYESQIKGISNGYLDALEIYHFIIITSNYNIDIITFYYPLLIVNGKEYSIEKNTFTL